MIDIPTYIICLPYKNEKRCKIDDNLNKYFSNIRKFTAITPKSNKLLPTSIFVKYKMLTNEKRSHYEINHVNQVGCYSSHYYLWEECIKKDTPIIVAEDDMILNDEQFNIIKEYLTYITDDMDYISFLNNTYINFLNKLKNKNKKFIKIEKNYTGTLCYYITPKGAKKLKENAIPVQQQVDSYIAMITNINELEGYKINMNLRNIFKENFIPTTLNHTNNIVQYVPENNIFIIFFIIVYTLFLICITITIINSFYNCSKKTGTEKLR
jgi:glycosyl transferase family 25